MVNWQLRDASKGLWGANSAAFCREGGMAVTRLGVSMIRTYHVLALGAQLIPGVPSPLTMAMRCAFGKRALANQIGGQCAGAARANPAHAVVLFLHIVFFHRICFHAVLRHAVLVHLSLSILSFDMLSFVIVSFFMSSAAKAAGGTLWPNRA